MKRLIGSSETSDIIMHGRYISDEHAELVEEDKKVYISDLNSQFGTFVNGQRINSKTELLSEDRVKIGTQLFHWQDYLECSFDTINKYPIYFKDLINIRGLVDWDNYKIILFVFTGFLILIPLAVPAFLMGLPFVFHEKNQKKIEELNLLQYSDEVTWFLCIICVYIVLNMSQKFIRFKLEASKKL